MRPSLPTRYRAQVCVVSFWFSSGGIKLFQCRNQGKQTWGKGVDRCQFWWRGRPKVRSNTDEQQKTPAFLLGFCIGGEGGIRTLDTLLTYTHFPGVRLQPLGHLSNKLFQISDVVAYLRAQTLMVLPTFGNCLGKIV